MWHWRSARSAVTRPSERCIAFPKPGPSATPRFAATRRSSWARACWKMAPRPASPQAPVDPGTLIRQAAYRIQAARPLEADRLRGAIRKAIELLQAAVGQPVIAPPVHLRPGDRRPWSCSARPHIRGTASFGMLDKVSTHPARRIAEPLPEHRTRKFAPKKPTGSAVLA